MGDRWFSVRSRHELEKYKPAVLLAYRNVALNPYNEQVGNNETADLLHYAPNPIEMIQKTPRREIGAHTFSHYYCLESGQTRASFAAG